MFPKTRCIAVAFAVVSCATTPTEKKGSAMLPLAIEPGSSRHFLIDSFSVPQEARAEFEAAMRRNMAFIRTLPGFLGHVAFEKAGGPTMFDVVTIAQWESKEAYEKAGEAVRAYYKEIGFDMPATLKRWGVRVERGQYTAPRSLHQ